MRDFLLRTTATMEFSLATTMRWVAVAGLLLSMFAAQGQTPTQPPDLVLNGDVTGAQNKTYFEVPFTVPAGTHRVSVDFQYTGKEERATLDLGVFDPERFRGESGGNKSHFTISETDATPSYLPGAIPAGLVASADRGPEHAAADCLSLPRRDPLQRARRGRELHCASAGIRHTLVSRRPAHAHGAQRWQLRQPERQDGALSAVSHRANGGCARPGLHRHHRPQRYLAIRRRCASCNPTSTASC